MTDQAAPAIALPASSGTQGVRIFAWIMIAAIGVYILNNGLTFWGGMPGGGAVLRGEFSLLGLIQMILYPAAFALAVLYVTRNRDTALRDDSARLYGIANFVIRAAFWIVFLVGLSDAIISFLRVEELLPALIGEDLGRSMNFNSNRAPMVHGPLILLGIVIAALTRGALAFHWLALLVVIAELNIVLSRFIFSYEQAFMGDLVRFWYGALFLFASAYTLFDDGHVRVDVLYSGFRDRTKGKVNSVGAILLGIIFCWVVIILGMENKASIINAPLLSLEVTQSSFGMYVKYLMAGFLGVFAVSMLIAFCAQLLEGVADWRGDPGSRLHQHDDELPGH
ncbi:MAG: TRAP transporter small permease subunit [Pseudomonadota bacterium]